MFVEWWMLVIIVAVALLVGGFIGLVIINRILRDAFKGMW